MTIIEIVLKELEHYVKTAQTGQRFDLLTACPSFASIPVVHGNKTSTTRALIGGIFAKKIGSGCFARVRVSMKTKKNGSSVIRKSVNKAIVYEIF